MKTWTEPVSTGSVQFWLFFYSCKTSLNQLQFRSVCNQSQTSLVHIYIYKYPYKRIPCTLYLLLTWPVLHGLVAFVVMVSQVAVIWSKCWSWCNIVIRRWPWREVRESRDKPLMVHLFMHLVGLQLHLASFYAIPNHQTPTRTLQWCEKTAYIPRWRETGWWLLARNVSVKIWQLV